MPRHDLDDDGLTDRQKEILQYIADVASGSGVTPTIREIGDRFDIKSTNGVNDHLNALKRKGVLMRHEGMARSLVLTTKGRIICGLSRLKNCDELEQAAQQALVALSFSLQVLHASGHSAEATVEAAIVRLQKAGITCP